MPAATARTRGQKAGDAGSIADGARSSGATGAGAAGGSATGLVGLDSTWGGWVIGDKTIYPDEATLQKLFVINSHDAATQRIINRLWTKVKTGR